MTRQTTNKLPTPQIGTDVKSDLANKILNRLYQISESKKSFRESEKVLGIFKCNHSSMDHIVISDHRILGVKTAESYGKVVFVNELTMEDIQSISLQAKSGWFWRGYYDLELDRYGKKSKYAMVKSTDVDNIIELIEKMKHNEAIKSLTEAQEQLVAEEKAERDRISSEEKLQRSELAAQARQAKKQARANAKQLAIARKNSGQCPKCGSDNLQAVHSTTQKGFSDGNACGGCLFLGPVGLLCGLCGSGEKQEQSYRMCLNCGNKF